MLFEPFSARSLHLANREVMAPMTRSRATLEHTPDALMATYYGQRATAGQIITEGTSPSPNGFGYPRIPGLYDAAQVEAWKATTDAASLWVARLSCSPCIAYQSVNPNDGKLLKSFEHMSPAALEQSLVAAETCFQTWKHTSYAERAVVVTKAAALLRAHVDDFATLETLEMRKRINEARGEVTLSADILSYYAQHAECFLAPVTLHAQAGEAHMESSPTGVLFCVEPWNVPYYAALV